MLALRKIDGRVRTQLPVTREKANSDFQGTMLCMFSFAAQLEMYVYEAHDALLAYGLTDEDEDVRWFMHYFECFRTRVDACVTLPEDVMQDFRLDMQHHCQPQRRALFLYIWDALRAKGAKNPAKAASLAAVTLCSDIMRYLWGIGVHRNIRRHRAVRAMESALPFLTQIDKRSERLFQRLEPWAQNCIYSDDRGNQLATELVSAAMDLEAIDRACFECMRENNLMPDQYKGLTLEEIENA